MLIRIDTNPIRANKKLDHPPGEKNFTPNRISGNF